MKNLIIIVLVILIFFILLYFSGYINREKVKEDIPKQLCFKWEKNDTKCINKQSIKDFITSEDVTN